MQITHSLHNLGVSSPSTNRHKRIITASKQQPKTVSPKEPSELEGSGNYTPLLSLPPHRYFPTTQVPCQAVNRGGIITLRRHPKMGWNRRLQWNQLSVYTKETIKGHRGVKSKYIPSDLFYFLSTIFHFQPRRPCHTIVLTQFSSGSENFSLNVLLNIACWKIVGSIWAYWCKFNREKKPQNLSPPQPHAHTKANTKILTSKLH